MVKINPLHSGAYNVKDNLMKELDFELRYGFMPGRTFVTSSQRKVRFEPNLMEPNQVCPQLISLASLRYWDMSLEHTR